MTSSVELGFVSFQAAGNLEVENCGRTMTQACAGGFEYTQNVHLKYKLPYSQATPSYPFEKGHLTASYRKLDGESCTEGSSAIDFRVFYQGMNNITPRCVNIGVATQYFVTDELTENPANPGYSENFYWLTGGSASTRPTTPLGTLYGAANPTGNTATMTFPTGTTFPKYFGVSAGICDYLDHRSLLGTTRNSSQAQTYFPISFVAGHTDPVDYSLTSPSTLSYLTTIKSRNETEQSGGSPISSDLYFSLFNFAVSGQANTSVSYVPAANIKRITPLVGGPYIVTDVLPYNSNRTRGGTGGKANDITVVTNFSQAAAANAGPSDIPRYDYTLVDLSSQDPANRVSTWPLIDATHQNGVDLQHGSSVTIANLGHARSFKLIATYYSACNEVLTKTIEFRPEMVFDGLGVNPNVAAANPWYPTPLNPSNVDAYSLFRVGIWKPFSSYGITQPENVNAVTQDFGGCLFGSVRRDGATKYRYYVGYNITPFSYGAGSGVANYIPHVNVSPSNPTFLPDVPLPVEKELRLVWNDDALPSGYHQVTSTTAFGPTGKYGYAVHDYIVDAGTTTNGFVLFAKLDPSVVSNPYNWRAGLQAPLGQDQAVRFQTPNTGPPSTPNPLTWSLPASGPVVATNDQSFASLGLHSNGGAVPSCDQRNYRFTFYKPYTSSEFSAYDTYITPNYVNAPDPADDPALASAPGNEFGQPSTTASCIYRLPQEGQLSPGVNQGQRLDALSPGTHDVTLVVDQWWPSVCYSENAANNCYQFSKTFQVNIPDEESESRKAGQLQCYPNPTDGKELTIENKAFKEERWILYITNSFGEQVMKVESQAGTVRIHSGKLQPGVYHATTSDSKDGGTSFVISK